MTTPSKNLKLQPTGGEVASGNLDPISPSITGDGSVVASARWKAYRPRRVAIATYSVADKKWTEYAEGNFLAGVAISPDGAKLAYLGDSEETNCGYVVVRVYVIDRKTLRETADPMGPCVRPKVTMGPDGQPKLRGALPMGMSFSPTGNRLAHGSYPIEVWDLDNNTHWKVADGQMPAWSPDGEWIAYINSDQDERHSTVGMVHPDGSGNRILITLPRNNPFVERPVWSPDSKTLLLNRLRDGEKWTMDIQLLDLTTLKLKTKFKDVAPVYGWAAATSY